LISCVPQNHLLPSSGFAASGQVSDYHEMKNGSIVTKIVTKSRKKYIAVPLVDPNLC
jgi:hypothetical protein